MNTNQRETDVDFWRELLDKAKKVVSRLLWIISFLAVLLLIYEIGFQQTKDTKEVIHRLYTGISITLLFLFLFRSVVKFSFKWSKIRKRLPSYLLLIFLAFSTVCRLLLPDQGQASTVLINIMASDAVLYLLLLLIFFVEISRGTFRFMDLSVSPALIFVISFLIIIFIGTGLLLLPNATHDGISFIDAIFTSTSAVCVTGLIVVDTATEFTYLGQFFILFLIQVGGLGIMTFTSFFGFFFKGNTSYQSQLFYKDLVNEENLNEIFRTLIKIVLFTFLIEAIGAFFIYTTISENQLAGSGRMWFSIFHSVSAFCNAGFSTLTNGLYESGISTNYNLHLIVAILIVVGGIGFPIIFNFGKYLKSLILRQARKYYEGVPFIHVPRLINVNTKIVVLTTAALLIFGAVAFFISEYNNTLAGKSVYGKFVTVLFGTVTPRTAGFNTVDMTAIALPTILIYLFLMWIGASPGSTGGGIKTSTFALSVVNTISLARGKDRVELFKREINNESIRRALSIVLLSVLVIGVSIFCILLFDHSLGLIEVIFECFSAYSTVGLSLGITGSLSTASKTVIVITMFIGRVGALTILVGIIRKVHSLTYRYPGESIFIN